MAMERTLARADLRALAAPMPAADFRTILRQLGLTQAELARILRVDGRTPQRWASGEQQVPGAVALALRLLAVIA